MLGSGDLLGTVDTNIESGMSVENACEQIVKAIYVKRYWITIGSLYY